MDNSSVFGRNDPAGKPDPAPLSDEAHLPAAVRTELLEALRYSLRWTVFESWKLAGEGGELA